MVRLRYTYTGNAISRMRQRNISEAEVENCINNSSYSYLHGANVVYVLDEGDGKLLKVRVSGGQDPKILYVFRVGES